MKFSKSIADRYTHETLSAREAQRQAEFIAWAPVIFQVSRVMLKFGIFDMLRDSLNGLTIDQSLNLCAEDFARSLA